MPVPVSATRVAPVGVVSGMESRPLRSPAYQGEKPTVTVQVPSGTNVEPAHWSSTTSKSGKSSGSVGGVTEALPKVTGEVPVTRTTTSISV